MRLDHLWIGDYKNLKDVSIDFDEAHWITVLIGWNGTGKSNVLEALATLFRDLIMGENGEGQKNKPTFAYKLKYSCREDVIHIDADPARVKDAYCIKICTEQDAKIKKRLGTSELEAEELRGKPISITKFLQAGDEYLPRYVFGYYSGHSDRMQDVFRKYLAQYDKKLRGGEDPGLRRLFYALPVHSQFVLLAFVLQQDEVVRKFLDHELGLDETEGGIDSVLFVLRQPPWTSKAEDGDPRFWNARGVVKEFLVRLYDIALAPIRIRRRVEANLWTKKNREFLYLYVKDLDALRKLVGEQAPREFFRDMESTYVSELIEEVRIRVKLRKNDGSVTFRELSEGEQQLLTVLGLLRFTAEEESLFLLDEPDTHLNPQWSVDYLKHLQSFVGSGDNDDDRGSSHIVLTTHNPLAIAELLKEQVQILSRDADDLSIRAQPPEMDPRGMGYAGIITSDMFGLAAAVDSHTLELIEEKRLLANKEELTLTDRERLEAINLELEGYGFRYETRDPVFAEYLKARFQEDQEAPDEQQIRRLPPAERREKARRLVHRALAAAKEQAK